MTYEEEFEEWLWPTLGLPDDFKDTIRGTDSYRIQKKAYLAARQKGEKERERERLREVIETIHDVLDVILVDSPKIIELRRICRKALEG